MNHLPTCPCCKRASEVFAYRVVRFRLNLDNFPAAFLAVCLVGGMGYLLEIPRHVLLPLGFLAILPFCTLLIRRFVCERCQIDFLRSNDFLLKAQKKPSDTPVSTANSSPSRKQ